MLSWSTSKWWLLTWSSGSCCACVVAHLKPWKVLRMRWLNILSILSNSLSRFIFKGSMALLLNNQKKEPIKTCIYFTTTFSNTKLMKVGTEFLRINKYLTFKKWPKSEQNCTSSWSHLTWKCHVSAGGGSGPPGGRPVQFLQSDTSRSLN